MKKRAHVFYSGSVQGVGFRYTTQRFSRRYPVTGFVKNLPDGSVELVAEGEEAELREFLKALSGAFRENIQQVDERWEKPASEFSGFEVRF